MLASTCTASCTGRWQERQHWVRLLASQHELPLLLAASKLAILQLAGGGAARGTHTHPAGGGARALARPLASLLVRLVVHKRCECPRSLMGSLMLMSAIWYEYDTLPLRSSSSTRGRPLACSPRARPRACEGWGASARQDSLESARAGRWPAAPRASAEAVAGTTYDSVGRSAPLRRC